MKQKQNLLKKESQDIIKNISKKYGIDLHGLPISNYRNVLNGKNDCVLMMTIFINTVNQKAIKQEGWALPEVPP